jgi:hypothetical protein
MHLKFWSQNPKGRDNIENLDVDERTILKWIFEFEGMNWINLAQDRD